MAKKIINIGSSVNDKNGDPLRTAFSKVNDNFTELYSSIGADVQIPVQTGNNGKFLTTNGTALSWATVVQDTGTSDRLVNSLNSVTLGSDGSLALAGDLNFVYGASIFEGGHDLPGRSWRTGLNIVGGTGSGNEPVRIYPYGSDGKGFGMGTVNVMSDRVEIQGNNQGTGGPGMKWTFDHDGNTTFPNGVKFDGSTGNSFALTSSTISSIDLRDDQDRGYYTDSGGTIIRGGGSGTGWLFDADNKLTFPDGHLTIKDSTIGRHVVNTTTDGVITTTDEYGTRVVFSDSVVSIESYIDPEGPNNLQAGTVYTSPTEVGLTVSQEDVAGATGSTVIVTGGSVVIRQGDGVTSGDWTFNATELTLPAGGDIVDSNGDSVLGGAGGNPFDQDLNTTNSPQFNNLDVNGTLSLLADHRISLGIYGVVETSAYNLKLGSLNGITFVTNSSNEAPQWGFSGYGETIFPNSILKTQQGQELWIDVHDVGGDGIARLGLRNWNDDTTTVNSQVTVKNDAVLLSTAGGQHTWEFDNTGTLTLPNSAIIQQSTNTEVAAAYTSYTNAIASWEDSRINDYLVSVNGIPGLTIEGWPFAGWDNVSGTTAQEYLDIVNQAWAIQTSPSSPPQQLIFYPALSRALHDQIRAQLVLVLSTYANWQSLSASVDIVAGPETVSILGNHKIQVPRVIQTTAEEDLVIRARYAGVSSPPSPGGSPTYTNKDFTFSTNGSLTFPDDTVQTTAFQDIPSHVFFVHPNPGRTFTQTGTYNSPFDTITKAITAAVTAGHNDADPATIILMANITENITMAPGVYLTSLGTGTHGSPYITGTVTVTSSTGTTVSNHYSISNLRVIAPSSGGHCILVTGTAPQKLFLRDMWFDAKTTYAGLYIDNTGSGSTVQMDTAHMTHSGSGDIYCINVVHGGCYVRDIETSGATQVAAVQTGAVMTIDSSELDANGDVVVETYGTGSITITNSSINNSQANSTGVELHNAGSVATIGNCLFNIPAGSGYSVKGVSGSFLYTANNVFLTANLYRSTAITATALPATWLTKA